MSRSTIRHLLACALGASLLAACGGGGGGDDDAAPTLQGIWDTTLSPSGDTGGALVLEDGALWAFSGPSTSIDALYQGVVSVNANSLSSANMRLFATNTGQFATVGNVSGSLAANTFSLTGSTVAGVSTVNGTRSPADATYNYDTPAQLSDIQGNWSGAFSTGDTGVVTVQATGAFSSTTSAGCSFTGTATPRGSGKNVFNVTLTFGPSPCLLPNVSGSGVALASRATGGNPAALIVMATTNDRSAAAIYLALRAN
jgi:hypothetical protein